MNEKDLRINFRYLTGNIACMSVDSVSGKPVHNDINNEEAIILFNSLVGEKEGCRTLKILLKENKQLKEENKKLNNIFDEIEDYMDDVDYKMGWQYANKLRELRGSDIDE